MRYTQPQSGPSPVDVSHPLAKGLALAVNPGTSPFRDMAGRTAVRNGISVASGPRGVGYVAAANASLGAQFATSPMRTSNGTYTGDFTYLVIANPIASTTREFFVCNQSGVEEFYFGANFNNALTATSGAINASTNNGGASGVTVSGAADGNPHVYAYTRAGSVGSIYVDGTLGGTATVSQTLIGRSTSSDYIGGYSGAGWGVSKGVFLVLGWNRALSAAEVKSISDNPWQLFKSPQRVMLASGAGTSYSYTATGGFTLSGSATKVRGAVKTASGGIALSGAATQSRGAVRSAAGGIQLAGASSMAKGRAITASGGLAISGAATILRGVARSAAGGLQLAGAASVTFFSAVQTRIVNPVGGFILSGATTVVRSIRKSTAGGIQLAGHAVATFGPLPSFIGSLLPAFIRRRRR